MDIKFLQSTELFNGIGEEDIKVLLHCFNGYEKKYKKGSVVFNSGIKVEEIGLILSGSVNIVANFYWGSSNIFAHIGKGDIFGENYAAMADRELVNDVVAAEDSEILFINLDKLLTTCKKGCVFHNGIIHNLFKISAVKNLNLSSRMLHIAPKSIRERVLSYLSEQALIKGSMKFNIPFTRQQLADYLGVDRSALSNELGKMKKDGLIYFHKNEFSLRSDSYLFN